MRTKPRRSLVSIALMTACGCGSAADLSIGSQRDMGSISADAAAKLALAKRFVVSAYPSTRVELEGAFDPQALPVNALYDWVEVYEYVDDAAAPDAGAGE
jgi:hypothetical protein